MNEHTTLTEAERELSLLLRRAAREYLGLADGDYWPSDVADAQARAVLAARVSTATGDTSGDDLRDRVTAVRDKWAAFVFYDVAAMQLRNSFRNDLDDALAVSPAPVVSRPETTDAGWVDKHGDVWREGDDGLMHTAETVPFPREHVERKWGPLRRAVSLAADPEAGA